MKLVLCLAFLAFACVQEGYAQNTKANIKCRDGSAAPEVCSCDLMFSATSDQSVAVVDPTMDPKITAEEFAPRVPGKRNRLNKKSFIEYCMDQCLNQLRARIQQKNVIVDTTEKAITRILIEPDGWDTLCDILFNPGGELTTGTAIVGEEIPRHYWLRAARRGCEDTNEKKYKWQKLAYLGVSPGCDCRTLDTLAIDVCGAIAGLRFPATYDVAPGGTPVLVT